MEVVLSQFVKSLTASGLLSADETEAFIETLPPEKKPDDGAALARELVRQKRLTKFQAQAIYQGKTKGLVLGDYLVLDQIGKGGMGQVYKAKHKVMKRVVALKTLPSAATKSEQAVRRFHREVEVAARLAHPNIVTAHDAGESHGVHYLVMEYVEGSDLSSLVRTHGRLPVNTALDYTIQAARGLEYAHGEKVIHRDIKPSNLLLDKNGKIKVLDMGLARLNQQIGPDDATAQETLTGTGQAMGTIDFMPPEQAENVKTADERSDIYSLGCTLFYLLTGRSVYGGDTTVQRLLAHRDAAIPSLRAERSDVPENVDVLFQKMVAKSPDDRYSSMTEVIAELEQCAGSRPEQFEETTDLGEVPLSSPQVGTLPAVKTEATPADDSLPLDLPVVSPVDTILRRHPKKDKKQQMIIGTVAAVVGFLVLVFGVVFLLRTPEGTLVITVNEADAEISVDDGKVTVKSGGEEPVEIEVVEGKHTLRVRKGGFQTFTKDFSIESGGKEAIKVELRPVEKKVVKQDRPTPVRPSTAVSSGKGYALELDGKDDYVHLPTLEYDGTHPITMEAFVIPRTTGYYSIFVTVPFRMGSGAQPPHTWSLSFYVDLPEEGVGSYLMLSDVPPAVNDRVHLTGVFDGQRMRLYINGSLRNKWAVREIPGKSPDIKGENETITGTPLFWNGHGILLGCGGVLDATSLHFHGTIDEVRISSIARYTEDFTPQRRFEPDEHTMALFHFDEGSGDVLKDSSGNEHHGKIVGAKWVRVDEELGVVADDPFLRPRSSSSNAGELRKVEEIGSGQSCNDIWVSENGHRIYYVEGNTAYLAVRDGPDSPFRDPKPLLQAHHISLTGDERRMIYRKVSVGEEPLYETSRLDESHTFENPRRAFDVSSFDQPLSGAKSPHLSEDGLYIWFNAVPTTGRNILYAMSRPSRNASWLAPTLLPVEWDYHDGVLTHPFLTEDGRALICVAEGSSELKLMVARRGSDSGPFSDFEPITTTKGEPLYGRGPFFVAKTHELFFLSVDPTVPRDRWSEDKNWDWDIWVLDSFALNTDDTAQSPAPTTAPPPAVAPFSPEQAKQHQKAWADHLGVPVEFTNSIGMKMVLIPPGEFMMGSSEEEIEGFLIGGRKKGNPEEWFELVKSQCPEHRARITTPFYVAAHEVTVGHFRTFVEATKYKTEVEQSDKGGRGVVTTEGNVTGASGKEFNWANIGIEMSDEHPVGNLTRNDIEAFCQWLSAKEVAAYRLPTEAQWEYACLSGSAACWHFGDDPRDLDRFAWYDAEIKTPKVVGQKLPNAFGLYDTLGNLREWCSDWYDPKYYEVSPLNDPRGPDSGQLGVLRGGCYKERWEGIRTSARQTSGHPNHGLDLGFRPVAAIR